MEFGTREILILLGIVIILGILLDGLRRVKQARNGTLRVSRRKQSIFDDEDVGELPTELLTGEVRVTRRDEQKAEEVSHNIKRYQQSNADKCTTAYREIGRDSSRAGNVHTFKPAADLERAAVEVRADNNFSASPPDFSRDIADDSPIHDEIEENYPVQPSFGDRGAEYPEDSQERPVSLDEFAIDDSDDEIPGRRPLTAQRDAPEPDVRGKPFHLEPTPEHEPVVGKDRRKPFWEESSPQDRSSGGDRQPVKESPAGKASRSAKAADQKNAKDVMEVIVLHVMAKKDAHFEGPQLLDALLANGLRYGDMGIFHRHESENGSGPVHFSLANSVKPGVFDLSAMETFTTPGVTLFMPLEGLKNPLDCFGQLIKTSQALAKTLSGELKDETRSALTKQTIEHYRQQIIEYTRRSFTLSH